MIKAERDQLVIRIRLIMADAKAKAEGHEYSHAYELGVLQSQLKFLCENLEEGRFPKKGR